MAEAVMEAQFTDQMLMVMLVEAGAVGDKTVPIGTLIGDVEKFHADRSNDPIYVEAKHHGVAVLVRQDVQALAQRQLVEVLGDDVKLSAMGAEIARALTLQDKHLSLIGGSK